MITIDDIKNLAASVTPPNPSDLYNRAKRAVKVLQSEDPSYRPRAKNIAGGLLDYSNNTLPLIVVPDLHARAYFLAHLMEYPLGNLFGLSENVFSALKNNHLLVVCVGDILHSEVRAYNRWVLALNEFMAGDTHGPAMTREMAEGLNTASIIMDLKSTFPKNFHILKGNHENILNEDGAGNYAFYKFVREGEMVTIFMEDYYGKKITLQYSSFEKALPLLAVFPNCLISHAEPIVAFNRTDIINAPLSYSNKNDDSYPNVIEGLTWTRNKEAILGSVQKMLHDFCSNKNARYIGGHRPVLENYETWQDGLYIQIHNPDKQNIAFIAPNTPFNPDTNIITISESTRV